MLTRRLKEFLIFYWGVFPPFGYRSSSSSGLKSIWGSNLRLTFTKFYQRSNVDLTLNLYFDNLVLLKELIRGQLSNISFWILPAPDNLLPKLSALLTALSISPCRLIALTRSRYFSSNCSSACFNTLSTKSDEPDRRSSPLMRIPRLWPKRLKNFPGPRCL